MSTDQPNAYLNEHNKYERLEREIERLKAVLEPFVGNYPADHFTDGEIIEISVTVGDLRQAARALAER